jgi:hypothetical protein
VVHAAEVNTWPAIPRIKAHCMVEMTLEQCVQRLRKRMTEESQREQLEALKQGGRATITRRDRTPSFYTSKSLVNLSGLSVADPAPIQQVWYHGNKNSREHLYQMAGGRSPRNSIHASKLNVCVILCTVCSAVQPVKVLLNKRCNGYRCCKPL